MADDRVIPILESIRDVGADRKAWLVDIWGVIHNGVEAFEESVTACAAFRKTGGFVVLVTNAPRPSPSVVEQLDRIGVQRDAYDAVVTSGDVTRGLINAWRDRAIHHLGPERDLPLFSDLDIKLVPSIDAEIIVCTGLENDEVETPETYRRTLERLLRRRALMICANPDKKVERGNTIVYCAGALGALYEEMGGDTVYAGKPHGPIYELAMGIVRDACGASTQLSDVLAIGDGVLTDIRGATDFGLQSVFVGSGIHLSPEDWTPEAVTSVFTDHPEARPLAALPRLRW